MHLIISQKRQSTLCVIVAPSYWTESLVVVSQPQYGITISVRQHNMNCRKKKKKMPLLTNHVLTDVRHSVELLLTDFTWELLFCIAVHNLNVLMQWPQLLKRLVAGDALKDTNKVQRNRFTLSLLLLINMRHKTWWPWDGVSNLFHYTPAPSTGEKSKRA